MPVPDYLALDLDDTILDYTAPGEAVWKRLHIEFAARMEIPVDELARAVDRSRRWYWSDPDRFREGRLDLRKARRLFLRDAFEALGRSDWRTADELADAFTREREIAVHPFPGAVEALERFRRSGARMVMLTNGEASVQRAKIERFGLAEFFVAILIESEVGFGKPDPRAHKAALAALGAAPRKAWMIGDDWALDVNPAKALGMRAAWIHDPTEAGKKPADITVSSLSGLASRWQDGR
jgi:HAD superfamily hydrolase (TIGR01509 family)